MKKMSSCQKDVKLSKRCQMSKSQTHGLWRRFTKKINWHNEVHTYWLQFWHQIWKSLKLVKNTFLWTFWGFLVSIIFDVKIDINMCESHYVSSFLFVNLLHSPCVWVFEIWHLFDNLTSFWHLFDNFTWWGGVTRLTVGKSQPLTLGGGGGRREAAANAGGWVGTWDSNMDLKYFK